jgi:prepilin-type N-terminal cleavage/methylation domain-containing protein
MKRAFTIIELLIVIGILGLIAVIAIPSFATLNSNQALEKDTHSVVAYLDDAKSRTLASRNSSQYGVRFASTTITLFRGSTFNAADPENLVFYLNSTTYIKTATLTGGALDVVFSRLTGEANQTGTIVVASTRATTTRTVTIYKTGAIESN